MPPINSNLSPSSTPTPSKTASPERTRKPWSTEDLRGVLQGTADPRLVREADRKGMSMATYGAMAAAVASDALLPLLDLLTPPAAEQESKIDVVITLLEAIAASQARIEARLAAIASPPARSS